ncbi:MAG: ATP-dependent DNA helicase RecG [Gammaproteobacteria bacterium]|nr:ATP-dependent DNA helicase RecG [Gammaproteobacteria bacterium]
MGTKASPSLNDSVLKLSGVGPRVEEKLNRIGILTIQDLLFHLPLRYQDKTQLSLIGTLQPGQEALIEGTIEITQVKFGRRRSLLCMISDGSGMLMLRFFHFSKAQQQRLGKGTVLRCYGQVRRGAKTLEIAHPEYRHIDPDNSPAIEKQLTAIYPLTDGLQQRTLQKLSAQALDVLANREDKPTELLPAEILCTFDLPELSSALAYVHRPPPDANLELLRTGQHPSQQRLSFEELLSQHLSLQRMRQKTQALQAVPLTDQGQLHEKFMKQLDFNLTHAQENVLSEIEQDLKKSTPMLRLLQGDVGSGKTVVSALAALHALASGYQVALMAPTELLAEQHFQTFTQWFKNLEIKVLLITGKATKSERDLNLGVLNSKQRVIAIGTHALFQKDIIFPNLGLIVIDEQHRFGVHQRLSLLDKGVAEDTLPHQLVMTATPIPRTLAMTVYADLDLSIIDAPPPNRQAINTIVISNERRDEIVARIKAACHGGRQVYWVCTLIEESEVLQCQTATETFQQLTEKLKDINIGLIHGRMKNKEKDAMMASFKENKTQLLVATTVIEVGVDVPNASLMIIENAERLGLFQLHQLRGRVGRGNVKSDCVLMYQSPLGDLARSRLETLRNTNDGFEIAEKDLQLRGPGELTGTRQTGLPDLRIADIIRDANLLTDVQRAAKMLQQKYPQQIDLLIKRWLGKELEYSNV